MFAETFENQAAKLGGWGTKFLQRHDWSDASGKILQKREDFDLPDDWEWEDPEFIGDWTTKTEDDTEYISEEEGEGEEGGGRRKLVKSVEVIYEFQTRRPFSHWPNDSKKSTWKDMHNDQLVQYDKYDIKTYLTKDTLQPPLGWDWDGEWNFDTHRSCDQEGWDYSFEPTLGGWSRLSKNYHIVRRRRWLRGRVQNKESIQTIQTVTDDREKGWEYARFHFSPYQPTYNKMFLARRRRYIRKIKTAGKDLSNPPHFYFSKDGEKQQVPRLFLPLGHIPYKFELRVYLYQARDLYAGDATGLSDPFCVVSFGKHSQTTRERDQTLNPKWDDTRLFPNIRLFENPVDVKNYPPQITVELFDKDNVGKDYLGYVQCSPIVRIRASQQRERVEEGNDDEEFEEEEQEGQGEGERGDMDPQTKLSWYRVTRYGHYAGELLAAFELILIGDVQRPKTPFKIYRQKDDGSKDEKNFWYRVPRGIRPVYHDTRIEILCWGVRDLKRYLLRSVTSPFVKIECGDQEVTTTHIVNTKKNPNFVGPKLIMIVKLPTDPLYAPPFNIHIYDKRPFGQKPLIGTHVIKSVNECRPITVSVNGRNQLNSQLSIKEGTKTKSTGGFTAIQIESDLNDDPDYAKDSKYDWWTKYDASIEHDVAVKAKREPVYNNEVYDYVNEGNDLFKIYPDALEEHFHDFYDVIKTFPLYRGKGSSDFDDSGDRYVGKFKGCIRVVTGDPAVEGIPYETSNELKDVIVRVYIIEAKSLLAQDPNGKSDPYIKITLGENEIDDSDFFIPNNLNPKFGRMFEIPATLPLDHTLKIQILDHDYGTRDDFIGETEIDIENRYLSSFRAICGLPQSFSRNGPNRWRDYMLPRDILLWYCETHKGLDNPLWNDDGSAVLFANKRYTLEHEELKAFAPKHNYLGAKDQQLALAILRKEGYLVPEHVETRPLYNPAQPGISQGSLIMLVDIFPKGPDLPPPVDISLRKPEDYVLRVIVYDVEGAEPKDYNFVTGEEMSDIYVKGWLRGEEETQKTDVHYRSFDGEGNFNWRFVFPFKYLPAERKIVVSKKDSIFSIDATESTVFPYLTIQVWDNDKFKFDEHLGTLEFNLTEVPQGAKLRYLDDLLNTNKEEDYTNDPTKKPKTDDLFEKKRIRRWWPLKDKTGKGRIELEIQVMTLEEAELFPAGKGRDEPNMNPYLPPPNRPETSFLWITSPLKTFRFIIWRYYKWHIMFTIFFIAIALLAALFIYSTPEYLAEYFLDRLLPF